MVDETTYRLTVTGKFLGKYMLFEKNTIVVQIKARGCRCVGQ